MAPLAGRGNVVVIHDLAPLREPDWFGRAYGAWHRIADSAGSRRARGCCSRPPSSCAASSSGAARRRPRSRPRRAARGVDAAFSTRRAGPRPRLALERPTCSPSGTDERAQEPRLLDRVAPALARGGPGVVDRRLRPLLPARVRPGRRAAARLRAERRPTGALRASGGARHALALRGLRAAVRRGDGLPAPRSWPPTAPRCPRRAAARRCWWTRTTRTPSRPR